MRLDTDFHFYTAYSREEPGNYEHLVRIGYVHNVYEVICRENKVPDPENPGKEIFTPALFYLCGWKNIVDEAKQRIMELGYDRKASHQELYG